MAVRECESATGASTHAEHGKRVADMFGRIAGWYDFLNHALSGCQDIYWRYRLAKSVRPAAGETVLDLAAGTMDVSVELLRQYPKSRVAALDFALPMLENGKAKKLRKGRENLIFPVQADGRKLPLADSSMGGATIAFGIRNILPREDAYKEFYRVLKPGTRLCILEFGTGSKRVWKGFYNFYLDKLLPFIGDRISGDPGAYRYLAESIKTFPDERALAQELLDAGFERVYAVPMMSGIVYLHVGEKPAEVETRPVLKDAAVESVAESTVESAAEAEIVKTPKIVSMQAVERVVGAQGKDESKKAATPKKAKAAKAAPQKASARKSPKKTASKAKSKGKGKAKKSATGSKTGRKK